MLRRDSVGIVTPTKCGTHSIEAMLKPLGFTVHLPRHAAYPAQYMMIRHPYERLKSGWWYHRRCRAWPSVSGFSFEDYCRKLLVDRKVEAAWRSPYIWSNNLTETAEICGATKFIRVEHLAADLRSLLGFGVGPRRLNTADRNPCPEVVLTDETKQLIIEWCEPDLKLGDYACEWHW